MRLFKRWRSVLIALVVIGSGAMAVAYVRSPGYRAAQAYARIQEGMTLEEADAIIVECGGYWVNRIFSPFDFCDEHYHFNAQCIVGFDLDKGNSVPVVKEKFLIRPSLTEWAFGVLTSMRRDTQASGSAVGSGDSSDANERMQELLDDSEFSKQIKEEHKRFSELDRATSTTQVQ